MQSNISFPNIVTKELLKEVAQEVIIPDIQGRMNSGLDINHNNYRSLSPITIAIKTKRGLRTEPLLATGQLRKSFITISLGNRVIIFPGGIRRDSGKMLSNAELGDILQNQGVNTKSGKRYFEFFGISSKAEKDCIKFVADKIRKLIDGR